MSLWQTIIEHRSVSAAAAAITTLGVIVAAVIVVDERYAHAADVRGAQQTLSTQLEINRLTAEVAVLQIRRATLEDRVYDAAARGTALTRSSAAEQSIALRYQAELQTVRREIADKQRLIDQLRSGVK